MALKVLSYFLPTLAAAIGDLWGEVMGRGEGNIFFTKPKPKQSLNQTKSNQTTKPTTLPPNDNDNKTQTKKPTPTNQKKKRKQKSEQLAS